MPCRLGHTDRLQNRPSSPSFSSTWFGTPPRRAPADYLARSVDGEPWQCCHKFHRAPRLSAVCTPFVLIPSRIRSHSSLSSSLHLFRFATPSKWSIQSLKLPSPLKASGHGSAHPADYAKCNRFQIHAQGLIECHSGKCTINQMSRSKPAGLSNTGTYISDVQSIITKGMCLSTKSNSDLRKVLPDEVSK